VRNSSDSRAPGTAQFLLVIAVVVVVVGGIAGFAIYRERMAPFQTTVLVVDDSSINMRYFLKRVHMAQREPLEVLQALTRELMIAHVAPQPPYDLEVSEQDVDQFIGELAAAGGGTATEEEVREWYRQRLNENQLSDAEFRELLRRDVLAARLAEYLGERMSTVAEQVRLFLIAQSSFEAASAVAEQLAAGADFFALARELNADPQLKARNGEVGWFPREALSGPLAGAFDLPPGEPSRVIPLGEAYAVAMVAERAAAREIEPEALQAVKANALDRWFNGEYQYHHVEFHGFTNGYDTETDLWVKWQLQRMGRLRKDG
jgi:hypothetical protein